MNVQLVLSLVDRLSGPLKGAAKAFGDLDKSAKSAGTKGGAG